MTKKKDDAQALPSVVYTVEGTASVERAQAELAKPTPPEAKKDIDNLFKEEENEET